MEKKTFKIKTLPACRSAAVDVNVCLSGFNWWRGSAVFRVLHVSNALKIFSALWQTFLLPLIHIFASPCASCGCVIWTVTRNNNQQRHFEMSARNYQMENSCRLHNQLIVQSSLSLFQCFSYDEWAEGRTMKKLKESETKMCLRISFESKRSIWSSKAKSWCCCSSTLVAPYTLICIPWRGTAEICFSRLVLFFPFLGYFV